MLDKLHALLASKGFVCPFAVKAEKEDQNVKELYHILTGDIDESSISHNPLIQAAKTFVDQEKQSLICALDDTYILPGDCYRSIDTCTHQADILEKKLVHVLADMTAAIIVAENKTIRKFKNMHHKGWPLVLSDIQTKEQPISGYTRDNFRNYFYNSYIANKSIDATYIETARSKDNIEHKYLTLYMGPIYIPNHPRYAPQSMVIINNFRHLKNVGADGRRKLIDAITEKAASNNIDYPQCFFSTPVHRYYTITPEVF